MFKRKKKLKLIKQLYNEIVVETRKQLEKKDDYTEGYIVRVVEDILNTMVNGDGYYQMGISRQLLTEREYNEHYSANDGGSDRPKYEKDMSPLHIEIFNFFKNDETHGKVNGEKELFNLLKKYAKIMYKKYSANKMCEILYAKLVSNKILRSYKKDLNEVLKKNGYKKSLKQIEEKFKKANCSKIRVKKLSKNNLLVLKFVLNQKIDDLDGKIYEISPVLENGSEDVFAKREQWIKEKNSLEEKLKEVETALKKYNKNKNKKTQAITQEVKQESQQTQQQEEIEKIDDLIFEEKVEEVEEVIEPTEENTEENIEETTEEITEEETEEITEEETEEETEEITEEETEEITEEETEENLEVITM